MEGKATWAEIRQMTINDVDLLNIMIDEWKDAERRAQE